jgi:threonine synthase
MNSMDQNLTSALTHLVCPECGGDFDAGVLHTFCHNCQSPLFARYDLDSLRERLSPAQVMARPRGLWRWAELLPVQAARHRLTLGEGDTPLLPVSRLGARYGVPHLTIKDEARNPTGSFKARGLVMAVARGVELGVQEFVIPTAGNAGGALAAYAARARRGAHVFMPEDAPRVNQAEVRLAGADLRLVAGLISDAAQQAARQAEQHGWFDVSTFKEPYRVEGKKTMGLELAQAFGWALPDVIVYPTGGGTGLVGMWKAFDELEALGWIGPRRPRMVTVQAEGCAPVVRAFQQGVPRAEPWDGAHTVASGLRVPSVFADRQILDVLRASHGTAVAVSDEAILEHAQELCRMEGLFPAPESAATLAALDHLRSDGWVRPDERVVLFNTGDGLKYL